MRKFKNVPKSKQNSLSKEFPELLSLYVCEDDAAYKKVSVSVFDHWLNKEEAIKYIDSATAIQEIENNNSLHNFSISLARSTETYLVKMLDKNTKRKAAFKEFFYELGMENSLIPRHHLSSDTSRFVLVHPQLNAVYFEGSDFTHHIYYKHEKSLEFISKIANETGLSII
jgi:hypothetical protein